jgi:hypothetical protein
MHFMDDAIAGFSAQGDPCAVESCADLMKLTSRFDSMSSTFSPSGSSVTATWVVRCLIGSGLGGILPRRFSNSAQAA